MGAPQSYGTQKVVLLNQSEVQLPATIKRQILEAEAAGKRKGFLFKGSMIWEDGELISSLMRLISSTKHGQNPAVPSKTKTKGSTQNSCSILKYYPLEPKATKWATVQLWSPSSLLEAACGASTNISHAASSSKVPYSWAVELVKGPVNALLGQQESEALS